MHALRHRSQFNGNNARACPIEVLAAEAVSAEMITLEACRKCNEAFSLDEDT